MKRCSFTGNALDSTALVAGREQGDEENQGSQRLHFSLRVCRAETAFIQSKGKSVGHVIDEVRRIRRKPNLRRHELHESVRRIAETLIRAFVDRD